MTGKKDKKSRKKKIVGEAVDNSGDRNGDGRVPNAIEIEATAKALGRRGRTIVLQGAVCVVGVFGCDYLLLHKFNDGHLGGGIVLTILTAFFVLFLARFVAWVNFTHLRRIVRNHPWDEWYARGAPVVWFGFEVARVTVLAHPEWPSEEIRTLHPRVAAPDFASVPALTVWVAGDPKKTLVVSPAGGASPSRAVKVFLPRWRRSIKERVERVGQSQ